jgi:hypothetical protein
MYPDMVNAMRAEIAPNVAFIGAKATGISIGADRQHLRLSNGEEISSRLVVLANGLNIALRSVRACAPTCSSTATCMTRGCARCASGRSRRIPGWLATPGMGEDKIGAFYEDAIKLACDGFSADKA